MTKSLRHLILDNIETTLAGITVANGYRTNFVKQQISRSALDFERQMLWPTVLIGVSDAPEELTSGSLPTHDEVNRRLTVDLTLGLNGLTSTLPEDVEYAIADILKAMAADATRGGYACTTDDPEIREPTYSQIIEGHAFVTISYEITYRHRRTDATIQ